MSNIKVEMLSVNDFDSICRTCSSDNELKSLFDNIETLSMLESLTQMQFSKTDELPDKICTNCLTKIKECYHFINNCKIIDEGLRKCLNYSSNQLEFKTDVLHSSIDIKQEEEPPESPAQQTKENRIDEEQIPESNENIKEIDIKQSEYYILKWGLPSENKKFQFTVVNNSSNEQNLVEQNAFQRLQAADRKRKNRTRIPHPPLVGTPTIDYETKIPLFNLIGERLLLDNVDRRAGETVDRRASETLDERENDTVDRRGAATGELHRARAKLTLPHEEHSAFMRRSCETPERIAIRRALAREQMRKYRSKLTADEMAEHRAHASENMRKLRVKSLLEDVEEHQAQAREYIRRYRVPNPDESVKTPTVRSDTPASKLKIPLRLSEMAHTLLQSNDPLDVTQTVNSTEVSRFSLRPSKIPQVKRYEIRLRTNDSQQSTKFRSWKRNESPNEGTIRVANNTLQVKRFYSMVKEPGQVEESALRRAKAAGQLRQYRPMRKNKTDNIVPHVQTGK